MRQPIKTQLRDDAIFTVRDFSSDEECAALIRRAHHLGFDAAPITIGAGRFAMAPEIRNNTRVILDDEHRARAMWARLAAFVPARRGEWQAVGLNERFRLYRYEPGQYFRWHGDGAFVRDADEKSMLTVMLYLDDDFEGGATEFALGREELRVVPERGMVLVFNHPFTHQGAPVSRGVKHVLRTDVMYRRT